MNLKMI